MAIWFKDYSVNDINSMSKGSMVEHLGIEVVELGNDFIRGTMPVDFRTKQPYGILHGGASITLAESLGSIAGNLCVDPDNKYCVGLDISGSHIRSVKNGVVTGICKPEHLGNSIQVWEIRIVNDENQLVNLSRLTLKVLTKRDN